MHKTVCGLNKIGHGVVEKFEQYEWSNHGDSEVTHDVVGMEKFDSEGSSTANKCLIG